MPRLSKIRIAGCKYDGFRKFYENSIFDLTRDGEPDHTLITLKNQGGKGVMLQLLSQIAMPETKWGKQGGNKTTSLFYDQKGRFKPYTFHVAMEWKLDTTPEKWLITGICMTAYAKTSNDEEFEEQTGMNYFMYAYEYDSYAYYTIEGLPMYHPMTREVAEFDEYERFVDENKKYLIKFSQSAARRSDSDYYRFLRSKGIFRSEWEILKQINKVEGGVGEYFAKAADNKSIFDKAIIPAITENMKNYMDDEQGSLKDMFRSHLTITRNLPRLLEREGDYANLGFHLEPLLGSAEIGQRRQALADKCIGDGDDLFMAANTLLASNQKSTTTWLEERKKAVEQADELEFQQENVKFVNADREMRQKEEEVVELEGREKSIDNEIHGLNQKKLVLDTSRLLLERQGHIKEMTTHEEKKKQLTEMLGMDSLCLTPKVSPHCAPHIGMWSSKGRCWTTSTASCAPPGNGRRSPWAPAHVAPSLC